MCAAISRGTGFEQPARLLDDHCARQAEEVLRSARRIEDVRLAAIAWFEIARKSDNVLLDRRRTTRPDGRRKPGIRDHHAMQGQRFRTAMNQAVKAVMQSSRASRIGAPSGSWKIAARHLLLALRLDRGLEQCVLLAESEACRR
ncbi:MAG: hypothetical protein IPP28_07305 [Xanthomonadales bacterium]|nr:hypothetical protein [Xanthomonadales bacterium]